MRFHRPSNGRPLNPIHFLDQDNTSFTYLDFCKNKTCNTKKMFRQEVAFNVPSFIIIAVKEKHNPIGNSEIDPYNAERILLPKMELEPYNSKLPV